MLYVCAEFLLLSGIIFVAGASCAILYDSYGVWAWQKWAGRILPILGIVIFMADACGLTHMF